MLKFINLRRDTKKKQWNWNVICSDLDCTMNAVTSSNVAESTYTSIRSYAYRVPVFPIRSLYTVAYIYIIYNRNISSIQPHSILCEGVHFQHRRIIFRFARNSVEIQYLPLLLFGIFLFTEMSQLQLLIHFSHMPYGNKQQKRNKISSQLFAKNNNWDVTPTAFKNRTSIARSNENIAFIIYYHKSKCMSCRRKFYFHSLK